MYRWHSEKNLMLRRWREEISKHEFNDYPYYSLAPIPAEKKDDICHCYRGMGFLRKKSPWDCGNSRCAVCHYSKFNTSKNRNNIRRNSIQENLSSWEQSYNITII